ncbi:MAG: hypothetical protein CL823_05595 [Crocinitomicaceae bacterium]|nr:hypothetical protein [Crocinitomicaceae bacterium]
MRIGFDAKRAYLNNTGLGNYSRDCIRILSERGADNKYHLFTTKHSDHPGLAFLRQRENTWTHLPSTVIGKLFKSYWRSSGITKELTNAVDLFHGLSNELPIGIEKTGVKSVVTIHDLIFIRYPEFYKPIDRWIYKRKFKRSCEVSDHIIAVSEQTKRDIIEFFAIPPDKITVVYQSCNPIFQTYHQQSTPKRDYLLYVGTIEKRKNLLTILKALALLPSKKLKVVGKGKEYLEECQSFISDHHLTDRVSFHQDVCTEELVSIYAGAEAFIYPSIIEGFGIPIIEALFTKTPVITTRGGCFSESGGPSSIYIDPQNHEELRDAILSLENADFVDQIISDGYKHAQNFTDEKFQINTLKIYNSLISRK